jgi:pyrroline-5-carboxylate reductase
MKPQNFDEELPNIGKYLRKDCVIVTIAAGITTAYICEKLGFLAKVVRVMPNTPLMLAAGASAITANESVSENEIAFTCSVFSALGTVERIDESQMNAIVSVNGSSPAYVYLFIKAMADASVRLGISYQTALSLINATVKGSVKMVEESGFTPEELIKMVSSPGGTTLKALDVFRESDFEEIIFKAMLACKNRADELSGK